MSDPVANPAQATPEAGNDAEVPSAEPVAGTEPVATPAKEKAAVAPEAVVPESYDLTMPEASLLQTADIERIKAEAKELGLTNDEAQEYFDTQHKAVARFQESQLKNVEDIRTGWVKSCETDAEIGGAEFKKNAELAKRVVDKYGSEDFKKILNESGFGNHPEVLRTFVRLGKVMAEDQLIHAKSQSPEAEDIAAKMYPSMAKK